MARYTKINLSFLISGLMHLGQDVGGTVPWADSFTVRFFITQALGVILEDAVTGAYALVTGKEGKDVGRGWRALGWVWVVLFLGWSTPALNFPVLARVRGSGDELVPVSLVKWVQSRA